MRTLRQSALLIRGVTAALAVLLSASFLAGCYFTRSPSRPLRGLAFMREAGARQGCLVIFIPGFLDGPDSYREHRFPDQLLGTGAPCDSVAVDLHYRYYAERDVAGVLYEDVLAPATARGYDEIWLVGISMGGLGTTMLASEHPELIDGVILLSPFLGDEAVIAEIERGGGLAEWDAPDPMPSEMTASNYTTFLWAWLRGLHEDPDAMPPIYIGWARGEQLESSARVLAASLPEGHVLNADGGHNWMTWGPLFSRILDTARIGRRGRAQLARASG